MGAAKSSVDASGETTADSVHESVALAEEYPDDVSLDRSQETGLDYEDYIPDWSFREESVSESDPVEVIHGDLAEWLGSFVCNSQQEYGGEFAWVGAAYRVKVQRSIKPLQWMNSLTSRVCSLKNIILTREGSFCRPGETSSLFPMGGLTLRWRWDAPSGRIVIEFWRDTELLRWRWDELKPCKNLRFPSTAPDFAGIGHVGTSCFKFWLISLAAEDSFDYPNFDSLGSVSDTDIASLSTSAEPST